MTYGANAPRGLEPARKLDGSAWTGAINQYPIASGYNTNIGKGDPVTLLADGTIGIGVAGSTILGIFQGCSYQTNANGVVNAPNWVASTTLTTGTVCNAFVIDDPDVVFTVQETDGSSGAGTPLALADRGKNINFVIGAPNSLGISTTSINNTTEADTSSLNCKLISLDPTPGNVVGSYANWLVSINNHVFKGGTGTSGV